jgi:NAD(P)-dependent dehydrogenase (short-subunit alcohol dehydrogenase family)
MTGTELLTTHLPTGTLPLEGKVAIVTGGGSGIGLATARAMAAAGAHVVIADVQEDAGEHAAQELRARGGDAIFVSCDVSSDEQVGHLVAETVRTFGALHVAFNNAGVEGEIHPLAECPLEDWNRTLAVDLTGVFLCMRHQIPALLDAGGGAIVNCASVAGLVGFAGSGPYVAGKHGVVGLTKSAALDYAAQGIRVNAVCPGVIETPMVERVVHEHAEMRPQLTTMEPIGRVGLPEEVASAVVWLCSDAASFVTGHALAVDGGLVAR